MPRIRKTHPLLFLVLLASITVGFQMTAYAQSAQSGCVRTIVGSPSGPTPTLPAYCNVGGVGMGNYAFPMKLDVVTSIATEMAAYPGGYTFGGHSEHAGLDIGAPITEHTPVYAVASGTVTASRESCYIVSEGDKCRLELTHDGDNFISSYTHVDVLSSVVVGSKLSKGQQIGVVHYWTDYANMDHLHFEFQSKLQTDSNGGGININPRNYFPELQQFKPYGYGESGVDVRNYTNSVGYTWLDDGKEYAESYLNHPPCVGDPGNCWAH